MAIDRVAQLAVDIVINSRRAKAQLANFRGSVDKSTMSTRKLALTIGSIGLAASAFLILRRAAGLAVDSVLAVVDAYAQLETKLVKIQKIARFENFVKFSEDFVTLGKELRGVSFEELSLISGMAARSGFANPDDLLKFTKAVALLVQVSDDVEPTQAAEGMARLLANFDKGADDTLKMVNAIDALSDGMTVTSGQILNITEKVAGYADAIDLSAEETLAFNARLRATGTTSTVVRSTMIRMLKLLRTEPRNVATELGLMGDEFHKFLADIETDPKSALITFIERLKQLQIEGKSFEKVLVNLKLATSRNFAAIINMVSNFEGFEEALVIANKAGQSTVNVLEKHAIVAETAQTRIDEMKKSWDLLKVSFANTDAIRSTTNALKALFESSTTKGAFIKPGSIRDRISKIQDTDALEIRIDVQEFDVQALSTELNKVKKEFKEAADELPRAFFMDPIRLGRAIALPFIIGNLNEKLANSKSRLDILKEQLEDINRINEKIIETTEEDRTKEDENIRVKFLKELESKRIQKKIKLDFDVIIGNILSPETIPNITRLNTVFTRFIKKHEQALKLAPELLEVMAQRVKKLIQQFKNEDLFDTIGKNLKEARERFDKDLKPFADPAGLKLLEQFKQLDLLRDRGLRVEANALEQGLLAQLAGKKDRKVEFRGLTEAWRQAQQLTNKDEKNAEFKKAQIAVLRELLTQTKLSVDAQNKIIKAIEKKNLVLQ